MRGRDKLTETIEGVPLIRRQALAALTTGCPVVVTLPPGPSARRKALDGLVLYVEDIPNASEGMSASLRRAAALLEENQSLGILLPDVPSMGGPDICTVLDAFRETDEALPTRATDPLGRPGTPLFLPWRVARRFRDLPPGESGQSALEGEDLRLVPFADDRATLDLDTPEDWAAWRKRTGIR